jgi:hypothetical protein
VTFTVPEGGTLVALNQLAYFDVIGGFGNPGYHALIGGATSVVPGFGTANAFLGGAHVFTNAAGFDMLPELADTFTNGTGFSIPLGPGDYSYVI